MSDYAELVERLRSVFAGTGHALGNEAADAIEELRGRSGYDEATS